MTPAQFARTVVEAVRRAVADGELDGPVPTPDDVRAERPRVPGRGDYATGLALRLARGAGRPPQQIARVIAHRLADAPGIALAEAVPPGFVNVVLDPGAHTELVRAIRAAGPRYGHVSTAAPVPTAPRAPAAAPAPSPPPDRRAAGSAPEHAAAARTTPVGPADGDGPRAAAVRRIRAARGAVGPAAVPAPAAARGRPGAPEPGRPPVADPRLGTDATAWAHVRPAAGDAVDPDPAVHLPQVHGNPLFRIRYAHARTRALLRNAADLGFGPREGHYPHPAESALLGLLAEHPGALAGAARDGAPDALARALERVADAYFAFQDACPVLPSGDEPVGGTHRARLALADATGAVLSGGLALLGISAPDHL